MTPTIQRRDAHNGNSNNDDEDNDEDDYETNDAHDDDDSPMELAAVEKTTNDLSEARERQTNRALSSTTAAVVLSKHWSVQTAHVPLYTGGKLVVCGMHDCILTPVFGNVGFTDCQTSTRLGTVRPSHHGSGINDTNDDDDDDDDAVLDMERITAYALAPNETTLVTCSHNSLMRQYTVSGGSTTTSTDTAAADAVHTAPNAATLTIASSVNHHHPQQRPRRHLSVALDKQWGKSGHTLPVTDLQFHVSGVFCASASVDGSVRVWDVRGGFCTHCFRRPSHATAPSGGGGSGTLAVTAIAWFPQPQHLILAVARDNGSVHVHNLRDTDDTHSNNNTTATGTDRPMAMVHDHVSAVTCLAWHVPTRLLVTAGRDEVVNVWRFDVSSSSSSTTPSTTQRRRRNTKSSSLEATPTRGQMSMTLTRLVTLPVYEQVQGLVLLPPSMFVGGTDGANVRRDVNECDSFIMATAGTKGCVRLWRLNETNTDAAKSNVRLELLSEQVHGFGEARGGYLHLIPYPPSSNTEAMQLLVADAEHNISYVTLVASDDTATTGVYSSLANNRTIVGHMDEILDLKVIPEGTDGAGARRIVVATNSSQVRLFDLQTFACHVLDRHTATVLCVDVSPCGRFVATCGKDKQMRMWQTTAPYACVAVATGHTEAIGSTALSRKAGRYDVSGKAALNGGGAFAVTVSMDRTLKRWNLPGVAEFDRVATTGPEVALKTFGSTRAHEKDINVVAIAPNDSMIATGSQDKTVKLWKATDLSSIATLKGHKRGVWDVCFSHFDRVVATASGDKTIKLWSLSDYSCVRTFQGHIASVLRVRFLSGGLQLVSSGADGLVKVWTVRTNESETTMDKHRDKVWALDLAPNGKELVSGGADSQIVVFVDTTKEQNDTKKAEEEVAILVDQKLANHLRRKEYGEALDISLERDKPHHTLKVLNAIIEADLSKGVHGLKSLKAFAITWRDDRLVRILRYCRDWNTRARNSQVALWTVKAIVSTVPAQVLASTSGVPEILAGIIPYTERHFERLDRLHSNSYLFDFVLSSMGVLDTMSDTASSDLALWDPKLVLPLTKVDGRVDVGGKVVVGATTMRFSGESDSSDDEVVTIGDSDDSDDGDDEVARR